LFVLRFFFFMANQPPPQLFLPDESATIRAGFCLGQAIMALGIKSLLVAISGDLGAGKTTFGQGLGQALGAPTGAVKSPTFALGHEYQGDLAFSHLDLFRLEDNPLSQFLEAGLEEFLGGLCLVEWPERLPASFWPSPKLDLALAINGVGRNLSGEGKAIEAQNVWAFMTQEFIAGTRTCA
jgi:tRNA threonylcarbamoyl adenosine modification protein YjeE